MYDRKESDACDGITLSAFVRDVNPSSTLPSLHITVRHQILEVPRVTRDKKNTGVQDTQTLVKAGKLMLRMDASNEMDPNPSGTSTKKGPCK